MQHLKTLGACVGLVTAWAAMGAWAADFTVSGVSIATNGGNTLNDGDSLTVTATGAITANPAIASTANNLRVNNQGTLISFGFAGMLIDGTGADLRNSGSITSASVGIGARAANATIVNTGLVSSVFSDGLGTLGANSSVTNSGTILARADGIFNRGANARITNSGTIMAIDDGIDSDGTGPDLITNTGTILAARDGIESNGTGSVITNSGTVLSGSDAFDLNGDNSTLNILAGSRIRGTLSFDGANGTLNYGAGVNAALVHDGGAPTNLNGPNGAAFRADTVLFAVNADQFRANRDHLEGLTRDVHAYASAAPDTGPAVTQGTGGSTSGGGTVTPWAALGARVAHQGTSGSVAGFTTTAAHGVAGLNLGQGFGILLGVDQARAQKSDSFETTATTLLGGVYGDLDLGGARLGLSLMAGSSDNTHHRTVLRNTGTTTTDITTGQNTTRFLSPALRLSGSLGQTTGSVELRGLSLTSSGYTETGSTFGLTFAERKSHAITLTPELSLPPHETAQGAVIDMALGLNLTRFSGDAVGVTFTPVSHSFRASTDDFAARAYLRGSYDQALDNGWTLRANGSLGASTLGQIDLSLGARLFTTF